MFTRHYGCLAHRVGLVDGWPDIGCDARGPTLQDGIVDPGRVWCVGSDVSDVGRSGGVKLEEQVWISARGPELLSRFPIESLGAG